MNTDNPTQTNEPDPANSLKEIRGEVAVPIADTQLLSPIDKVSEILFGVIMALTFTCTFEVAKSGRSEIRDMLFAALGCNIVWGLVDGIFFILMGLTAKRRGLTILRFIRLNREHGRARDFIAGEIPPVIASVLSHEELENIRNRIANKNNLPKKVAINKKDLKAGGQIFLLVFLSTLPVIIPFLFMSNARTALRISNLIAIIIMYICGWMLGRYASRNPWTAGFIISLIGIGLVLLAIYLGG
jgi:hypothetical protein